MHDEAHQQEPTRPLEAVSTGTLLRELFHHTTDLFRKEVELAKSEVGSEVKTGVRRVAGVAVAAVFAGLGVALLCTAAVIGLATHMAPWLAALVMAVVLFAIAGATLAVVKARREHAPLTRTRRTLKEDVQWAKTRRA